MIDGMSRGKGANVPFTAQRSRNRLSLVVIDGRPVAPPNYLGDMLRDMRTHIGRLLGRRVTLDDASAWLGVESGTIGRWERGENSPDRDSLVKIAHGYKIPHEWWWVLMVPEDWSRSMLHDIWTADDLRQLGA